MKDGERVTKVQLDPNGEEYKRIEQSVRATCQNTLNQIVKVLACSSYQSVTYYSFFVNLLLVSSQR